MEGGRSVEEEEEEEEEVGDGSREDSDGLAWKEFFGKWDNYLFNGMAKLSLIL